jgi:hypothetical protein
VCIITLQLLLLPAAACCCLLLLQHVDDYDQDDHEDDDDHVDHVDDDNLRYLTVVGLLMVLPRQLNEALNSSQLYVIAYSACKCQA